MVSNIDEVEVHGAELNLAAGIVEGWSVLGSANVTESEIKANASRQVTVSNNSPYTADYTINLGTQLDLPVSNTIDFVTRADDHRGGIRRFVHLAGRAPALRGGAGLQVLMAAPAVRRWRGGRATYSVNCVGSHSDRAGT